MRRNARRYVVLVAMLLLSAQPARSDIPNPPPPTNILYGFINSNATLTVASPGPIYYVVGDLIVNPGVTLSIQPGVTLRFAANRDTLGGGDYPSHTELRVRGHLVAQGTVADSIRFLSTNDGFAEWGQIRVDAGASVSLRRLVLMGAQLGLNALGGSALGLAEMRIRDCGTGLTLAAGATGTLQACSLEGNGSGTGLNITGSTIDTTPPDTGIVVPTLVSGFGTGVAANNAIVRNVLALRNGTGFLDNGGSILNYCTAAQNGTGFAVRQSLLNSIAASNTIGIRHEDCGTATGSYVDSWLNGSYNFYNSCGPFLLDHYESFNPFFVNPAADDYRLSEGSIFESYSSTGGQIGAYGPHRGPSVVDAPEPRTSTTAMTVSVIPNPTRGRTQFVCRLPKPGAATAEIIDLTGRKVRQLTSAASQGGSVAFTWDGSDERGVPASPGLYYWRVIAGSAMASGRVIVVK